MGEAQLSTIVGEHGIGVADVRFSAKREQKGRTTRKAQGLWESYAGGGAVERSGVARVRGPLPGPFGTREDGIDGRVLLGLVHPTLGLHDHPDHTDEEHGHDDRGHERGDVVHASRVAMGRGAVGAGWGEMGPGLRLRRVRAGRTSAPCASGLGGEGSGGVSVSGWWAADGEGQSLSYDRRVGLRSAV